MSLSARDGALQLFVPHRALSVTVRDEQLARLLLAFTTPRTIDALPTDLPRAEWVAYVKSLRRAEILVPALAERREARGARLWDAHDLGFHAMTRLVRGGTFRFAGTMRPEPRRLRSRRGAPIVALPEAPPEAVLAPLGRVLRQRRSTRAFGTRPIPASAIGAILDLAARERAGHRAYPSAGACYPIELYVVAGPGRLDGAKPAAYHYRPHEHVLERVSSEAQPISALLAAARRNCPLTGTSFVLVCLTARYARTSYKYRGNAYAHVLKEVGCLMEALYVAAAALGLGVCALGGGPLHALHQIIGADPLEEPTVGELLIGLPASSGRASLS